MACYITLSMVGGKCPQKYLFVGISKPLRQTTPLNIHLLCLEWDYYVNCFALVAQNHSIKSIYASQESFYKFLDGITMVFSAAHLNLNQNYLCGGVVYATHKMCGSAPH